ncbi:MAG: hypothetical protein Ct9H300mP23_10360 [Nitrospinota bacterium]|nr:MAG: hypothetical protein Ct9H300mP23_10360 [Nitrospinota bacterium]
MKVTAWDMESCYKKFGSKPGDALLINLVDLEKGIFQVRPYSSSSCVQIACANVRFTLPLPAKCIL